MAGTGKGALRIAIEDWFETSPIGKWFANIFHKAGEDIELGIVGQYKDMIAKIQAVPGLEDLMKITFTTTGEPLSQGGILTAGGFATALGTQAASSLLAPYMRVLNYAIDKSVHSQRVDLAAAIAGFWRDPDFKSLLEQDLQDLGFTKDRVHIITELSHPRVTNQELLMIMLRGQKDEGYVKEELAKRGYLPDDIEIMLKLVHIIPSPQDLITMAVREAFDPALISKFGYDKEIPGEAKEWAKKQGLDPEWFDKYWYQHWILPSATMGFEMVHRLRPDVTNNPFTENDLALLLKALDYPVYWRDKLTKISYSPYTRVDVRRMFKLGILTVDQLVGAYKDLGYDQEHAKNMADFTIRYETESGASKLDQYQDMSASMSKALYNLHLIGREEYKDHLLALKNDPRDVELIIRLTDMERMLELTPDRTKEFQKDMQDIILNAYSLKIIPVDTASDLLGGSGLPANQAVLALAAADYNYAIKQQNETIKMLGTGYSNHSYTRSDVITKLGKMNIPSLQQQQIMIEFDASREIRTKRLTEAAYTKAYLNTLMTLDEWTDAMEGLGYSDPDITLLKLAMDKGINI